MDPVGAVCGDQSESLALTTLLNPGSGLGACAISAQGNRFTTSSDAYAEEWNLDVMELQRIQKQQDESLQSDVTASTSPADWCLR